MLEIGMYVKFKDYISKITHINKTKNGYQFVQFKEPNGMNVNVSIDLIKKASHNIIEILELGDLIEVECEKGNTNVFEVVAIDYENNEVGIFNNNFNIDFCSIEQIKSILTKEQFESMTYKVGEYYVC